MIRRPSTGIVVSIAVAAVAGFLIAFAVARGLSSEFWVALAGALVGGVLAMVGNYFGSRALIEREERQERRSLVGAIQVARSEISVNFAVLQDLINQNFVNFVGVELHDTDFRQVNVALARALPTELFADVSTAMNGVRRTNEKLRRDKQGGAGGLRGDTAQDCRDLVPHLQRINRRLLDYATENLGVVRPKGTQPNPFEGQGS